MQRPNGCCRLNLKPSGRDLRTCHKSPSGNVMSPQRSRLEHGCVLLTRQRHLPSTSSAGSPPHHDGEEHHEQAHFDGCLGGGGAVAAYSAAVSVPDLSPSAPLNLSIVLAAHSSNDSAPLALELS